MNVTIDLKYCMYKNVILNTPLFCQNYCFVKSSTPGSFRYHAQINVLPKICLRLKQLMTFTTTKTFKTSKDIKPRVIKKTKLLQKTAVLKE